MKNNIPMMGVQLREAAQQIILSNGDSELQLQWAERARGIATKILSEVQDKPTDRKIKQCVFCPETKNLIWDSENGWWICENCDSQNAPVIY